MALTRLHPAELHVSVSQVKTYLACPRKYELRYVLGIPPETRALNLAFGSAIHEGLAAYYVALKNGTEPNRDEVLATFSDSIDEALNDHPPVLLDDDENAGTVKDKGVALLEVFLSHVERPDRVLAVEQPFAVDVKDPRSGNIIEEQFTGVLDALVEIEGHQVILEHKTAAKKWSQDQIDHDLQAGAYLAAIPASCVRLQCLLKTKTPSLDIHDLIRSEPQKNEAIDVICRVLDAIRAGAFWRNRGWACRGCEFEKQCG